MIEPTALDLADQPCVACRGESSALTEQEWAALAQDIAQWQWVVEGEVPRLRRRVQFKNFATAFAFVTKVAELAETYGHHPELRCGWGFAEVDWWTHKIGGVHRTDAIMAAKCDRVLAELPGRV